MMNKFLPNRLFFTLKLEKSLNKLLLKMELNPFNQKKKKIMKLIYHKFIIHYEKELYHYHNIIGKLLTMTFKYVSLKFKIELF